MPSRNSLFGQQVVADPNENGESAKVVVSMFLV